MKPTNGKLVGVAQRDCENEQTRGTREEAKARRLSADLDGQQSSKGGGKSTRPRKVEARRVEVALGPGHGERRASATKDC